MRGWSNERVERKVLRRARAVKWLLAGKFRGVSLIFGGAVGAFHSSAPPCL